MQMLDFVQLEVVELERLSSTGGAKINQWKRLVAALNIIYNKKNYY